MRSVLWILLIVPLAIITAIVAVFLGSLVRTHQQEVESGYDAVYVVSVEGSGLHKLTSDKRDHQYVWSPDGRQIVAQSDTSQAPNSVPGPIELMGAGGGAVREVHAAGFASDPAWRSEHTLELLDTASVSETRSTSILELSLPDTVRRGRSIGPIGGAAWSPDGAAVAFVSGSALYTAPLAGGPARKVVGLSGHDISDLSWSPDGRKLGFVASVETPQT